MGTKATTTKAPTTKATTKPPTKPATKPATKPPTKAPTKPATKPPTKAPTKAPTKPAPTTTRGQLKWVLLSFNGECDTDKGEVYLDTSPKKVANLQVCQKTCQDSAKCKSITFFPSRWCSHYSTSCANVRKKKRAIAMRWVVASKSGGSQQWVKVSERAGCDTGRNERYLDQSPGKLSSIAVCKKSCEDSSDCQSITFFKSGWCSHFSTSCTNTIPMKKAVATWRLVPK